MPRKIVLITAGLKGGAFDVVVGGLAKKELKAKAIEPMANSAEKIASNPPRIRMPYRAQR